MTNIARPALTLALALAASFCAASASDSDFAGRLDGIRNAFKGQMQPVRRRGGFLKTTQASGPEDPLLLAQKPLLDMIGKVDPSVVLIKLQRGAQHGQCAGFFVDTWRLLGRPSLIVSSAHCFEGLDTGSGIEIGLYSGKDDHPRMTQGRLLALGNSKAGKDIALLELLDSTLGRRGLPLWSKLERGETVVAIGHPLGQTFSVSRGIVSALGRNDAFSPDTIQVDAALNQGNSGGPLFNLWGSVVGLVTGIATPSGGSIGLGYATSSDLIELALRQYKRTGNLDRSALGVVFQSTESGPTVGAFAPESAAAAAGLQVGDQIAALDSLDLSVMETSDALRAIRVSMHYRSPGETVSVTVRRDGTKIVLPVTLGSAAPSRPQWAPIPEPAARPPKKGRRS